MCNVCKHYSELILCDSQELTRVRWVPTNYVRESENCTHENESRAGQSLSKPFPLLFEELFTGSLYIRYALWHEGRDRFVE